MTEQMQRRMVLPLIEPEVVTPGWLSEHDFIAGYGAA
jgi:hypothetical protein